MNVAHILLGRPWKFDKGAIHNGRRNTYTFLMGKTEIILLPCKDFYKPKSSKEEGNAILTLSQFKAKLEGVES